MQVFPFCDPKKENCVANQTLKDQSCLVPCAGLYADIVVDSFKQTSLASDQNVMKGLNALTQELSSGVKFWKDGSRDRGV